MNSELLGPQFSPFSLAFYFSLANILFCPRLIRACFSVFADWHRSRNFLTGVTLYHPQDEALHLIVAFTLLVLCTGCSCTKVPGTTMEPTEATLQPANSAKRIQPLDLLKRFHKRGINCPDGRSSRPSGDTCCLLSSNGYGCCPHLLTPFVAMTGSIAVRRVTAVVQAATVTNKEPVINLVIEL